MDSTSMAQDMSGQFGTEAWMAKIEERLDNLAEKVDHINDKLDKKYVTHEEFKPIKLVVYGLVGAILTSFAGAMIALIIRAG